MSDKTEVLNEPEYYGNVYIVELETYPKLSSKSMNNVKVTFKDYQGYMYSDFYLNYPDGQIEGGGVYLTLFLSLINERKVTLKTNGFIGAHGEKYITGVIVV
ncbi:hypothetical protein Xbed_01727 [Xenorhabdus beddingii]|uniref:Uncharacterized protein n=1 Tax=Xenorhabdus beddingii TaxID=40578 RepID=A0A1Y2SMS4_9GAMM|nr:hypothetical protein [Xenorhabdus beddingii]OTA20252.1 hypothetical protein Xbed_01727 [Xenorhabdus beddingii]